MVLVYNRWSMDGIQVMDPGLKRYINLEPRVVPHTGGKEAKFRFHKNKVFIIERFMNKLMNCGHKAKKHFISSSHTTGKGHTVFKIMEDVLTKIEDRTKQNPIQVVVAAIENAAPREEIITIEYGGARYPKAVEVAPQRRIDYALRLICQISCQKSFNKKKSIVNALVDELLAAYKFSNQSGAISKKLELERQADSSR
ncbi:30S ribosomal protein S7 [Nanoarchaeota archaeon]